jgi:hypothetical protein
MHVDEGELVRLTQVLRRIADGVHPSVDPAWTRPIAIRVIDCVLSLNRNYDRFVVPRVEAFMRAHPAIRSIDQLGTLMATYPSPASFVESALNYDHADRARVLDEVVRYLSPLVTGVDPDEQPAVLGRWAVAAHPGDFRDLGIKGFKLAGFQYLRMLLGAQTTKPDKHIIAFVTEALQRRVRDLEALVLLEAAAARAHLPIRDVDTSIWEARARGASS